MKTFRLFSILAAVVCATMASCVKPEPEDPKPLDIAVTGISLSESSVSISVNEEKTLVADVKPSNATDKTVNWSSDNASVASVADGKVKGLAPGKATITAKAGNFSASCTVTVTEPILVVTGEATDISWSTAKLALIVNQKLAGSYKSYDAGIIYGTNAKPSKTNDTVLSIPTDKDGKPEVADNYEFSLTDLNEATTYYYMGFAVFDGKEYLGEVKSFKTGSVNISTEKMVDLGLSVKWAGWNVGATKPEEFGDYFSWGEVQPKDSYWQDNYKYGVVNKYGTTDTIFKYNVDSKYGNADGRTRLMAMDDAAHVNWGDEWRMPTDEEKTELLANTTHTKYVYHDVPGWLFTSVKNNVSIFFPATGVKEQTGTHDVGKETAFWTSTLRANDPRMSHIACNWIEGSSLLHEAGFEMDPISETYHLSQWRYYGIPVRAVSGSPIPQEKYTLTTSSAESVNPFGAKVKVAINPAASTTEFGLLYTDSKQKALVPQKASSASADASGYVTLQNLTPSTDYYACAYAIVDGTIYYGNTITFRTKENVTLTVLDPEDITHESAKLKAQVSNLAEIIAAGIQFECGIAYEKAANGYSYLSQSSPSIALTPDKDGNIAGTVSGLPYNTKYYYKAYLKIGDVWYFSKDYKVFTTGFPPLEKWVDLGLSVMWASWDIGAGSGDDDQGSKFAWGETTTKNSYSITNYKWANEDRKMTKYVTLAKYGHVDNKVELLADDDAATAAWGSEGARMPTRAEFKELIENCKLESEFYKQNQRIKFTGPNGNYIYLDRYAYYWTSSLDTGDNERAYIVYIDNPPYLRQESYVRTGGYLIRAVKPATK